MLISLNKKILPPTQAKLSVLDHGFLYGDSVYETLRTYNGIPFLLQKHLERLENSASQLGWFRIHQVTPGWLTVSGILF